MSKQFWIAIQIIFGFVGGLWVAFFLQDEPHEKRVHYHRATMIMRKHKLYLRDESGTEYFMKDCDYADPYVACDVERQK